MRELMSMNLSSAMEYRVSFISQIVGMFINNGIYFIFWLLFFDAFGGAVQGYYIDDIFLLFAIITVGYGLAFMFAANTGSELAYLIAQGRLDYYLVLPRVVLPHVIFSRMSVSTIGDITFGFVAYLFTGRFSSVEIVLFLITSGLAAIILAGFSVITGSLAFYIGSAQQLSQQAHNAILTFALYPNTLFTGLARFMLYTLVPAAFIGAIPVEIVRDRSLELLVLLIGVAIGIWLLAIWLFYRGLRRYESGSAINVNV